MVMLAFCDAPGCKQRIDPKDHLKIDVLNKRRDVHRGECYNIVYAHKMGIEAIAHSQVSNFRLQVESKDEAFWKDGNAIGIPETAPR